MWDVFHAKWEIPKPRFVSRKFTYVSPSMTAVRHVPESHGICRRQTVYVGRQRIRLSLHMPPVAASYRRKTDAFPVDDIKRLHLCVYLTLNTQAVPALQLDARYSSQQRPHM